ncbi:hypothetical protein RRG08_025798 [Elysia crispata]|uniref:Uncharacterized protein n=1 Tax=Elysia crispata TaxID=231223 RepID=A0AAE0Y339_9GAST|nr:hypothetical protein RRG08_025798 [Elysia crispata]
MHYSTGESHQSSSCRGTDNSSTADKWTSELNPLMLTSDQTRPKFKPHVRKTDKKLTVKRHVPNVDSRPLWGRSYTPQNLGTDQWWFFDKDQNQPESLWKYRHTSRS